MYSKSGPDDNWYYSVKECRGIYKTEGGKVFKYDPKTGDWVIATYHDGMNESGEWFDVEVTYSDLIYLSNYTKVTKEDIDEAMRYIPKTH